MPAPFTTTRRVEFRDTDAAGIAHFSVFFVYLEQAEHELLRSLGWSVHQEFGGETISWPRVAARCDFRSAARFEEVLQIDVSIKRLGGSSITYVGRFTVGERLLAEAEMTVVCCALDPDRPPQSRPIPEELRAKLAAFVVVPPGEQASASP